MHEQCLWLVLMLTVCAAAGRAQGAAPETAPPLFPGGGLISYNSVFTTRGLMPSASGGIPATAFPTFSHQGTFNFTWGFYSAVAFSSTHCTTCGQGFLPLRTGSSTRLISLRVRPTVLDF